MPKKKNSTVGYRRKQSNTTTRTPINGAKRSKTEEKNPAEYRNGILQGITALLGKMNDKDLLAVMMHVVSTMEDNKNKSTSQ
eukprot:CAMPEP_0201154230 /NCGR_PEP_ID=MMETSP0851-20130426/14443_1 /ASSEMBLY_ACC=CAM_ASM_000631 /TAXON_ID=183588 /ORGANISM="Pseudo-nitzschia fraudulenta, Strain WWA7" /LENGTH=81 /DNA_ID=CAMNT_0047431549 /DNA_START=168 /DNA_END=413 /DNA_ORIENTATION=+